MFGFVIVDLAFGVFWRLWVACFAGLLGFGVWVLVALVGRFGI